MKIKLLIIPFLFYAGFIFQSCTELRSPHYVGDLQQPQKLDNNLESESIWQFGKDIYHAGLADSVNVIVSGVEWKEETKTHVLHKQYLVITKLGAKAFINMIHEGDSLYSIYRITGTGPDNGDIALLTLNKDSLDKVIKETGIDVNRGEASIALNLSKPELDRFMQKYADRIFPFSSVKIIRNLTGYKRNTGEMSK